MTRTYPSLSLASSVAAASVFSLALVGCAKNPTTTTQNPATTGSDGTGAVDGTGDSGDDTAATPSRARGSTAPRGAGRNTKARKVTAKKPPRAPVTPSEDAGPNGLQVEAFALAGAEAVPAEFSSLGAPIQTFVVANLDYDEVDASAGFPGLDAAQSDYALRFTGSINVVEEAEYELCLHSDDGSQLLLEGSLIVDNDGLHEAPVETCELVYLAPGEYALEVRYFQASGPLLAMHFAWAINGGDKVIVPTEVLFKP